MGSRGKNARYLLLGAILVAGWMAGYVFFNRVVAPIGVRGFWGTIIRKAEGLLPGDTKAPPGAWTAHATASSETPEEALLNVAELSALGYLGGNETAPASSEVIPVYDTHAAYDGLNLVVSGHAPEALLMDMQGKTVHRWTCDSTELLKGRMPPEGFFDAMRNHWRRAHVFPNGNLLAVFNGLALTLLDKDSNVLWAYLAGCHHDLFVDDLGYIYVLVAKSRVIPSVNPHTQVLEDYVVVLNPEGEEVKQVSLLKAFQNSSFARVLNRMERKGDLFHTNTLEVFDGSLAPLAPMFKKGNALVSVWKLDTIAIVDLEREQVVWAMTGMWHRQHQPTLLNNGAMLIFDNLGYREHSKVIEFDPLTQEVVWNYHGTPPDAFFSERCGSCQRLPNGNTLITETNGGRAFEVSQEGTVVWEFVNPHRAGSHGELIANLFEVTRLRSDFPDFWQHD